VADWVLKWNDLYVAGCEYYPDACKRLIDYVRKNGLSAVEVVLEHHPDNPHDTNAVAVFAKTVTAGCFLKSTKKNKIGHIPAYTARDMVYFRNGGGGFRATLAKAKKSRGEYPFDIKLDVYTDYKYKKKSK